MYRARLWIIRAVDQTFDAGVHYGTGAHGARFNCNKQLTVSQTVVTNGCTGFAEGDDLRVGGRIGVRDVAVPSAADDFSFADHNGAHWNFIHFESALGAAEGFFHPEFVGTKTVVGRLSLVVGHSVNEVEVIVRGAVGNCGADELVLYGSNHVEHVSDDFGHDSPDYGGNDYAGDRVGDRQGGDDQ